MATIVSAALLEHGRRLYGYALSLAGDADAAADLFQDCALRALSARRPPSEPQACRAWLFVVLRNAWLDRLRHERAAPPFTPLNVCDALPGPICEQQCLDRISVQAAMAELSPALRETLALVDIGGFRYAEAAQILGVPVGTVMSRMADARRKLATLLAREGTNVVVHPAVRRRRA